MPLYRKKPVVIEAQQRRPMTQKTVFEAWLDLHPGIRMATVVGIALALIALIA